MGGSKDGNRDEGERGRGVKESHLWSEWGGREVNPSGHSLPPQTMQGGGGKS